MVGFIGLGNLGSAIAKRLESMGEEIIAWNRTEQKAKDLGFNYVKNPKDLWEKCDTVFVCLFESSAVREVFTKENGLLEGAKEGKTIVDLTTNHFKDVLDFHTLAKDAGINYLESPVLGSVIPATKGELTVVASGDKVVFNKITPLLEKFAKNIFHLPEPSFATKMKLIINLCLGSFMATLAESTVIGEACGIDKKDILDILNVGGGQSLVLSAKYQKLLNEDFSPHFSNSAINKDLHCLQDLAYTLKKPLYSAAMPKELFSKARGEGRGDEDFSSIYELLK